jgi:protein-tyrosine phosphatase
MKASEWAKMAERSALTYGNWSKALGNRGDLRPHFAAMRKRLHRTFIMDMTWLTGRIAVGGGIWSAENMAEVARAGVTHIIDMQIEFDDTPLAEPHGITVLWNPIDDDFRPKPPEIFERGVDFALEALDEEGTKLFVHCAAGVHRAPMMTLAILCSLSWNLADAVRLIETRRPVVDFADVYVNSVKEFLLEQVGKREAASSL